MARPRSFDPQVALKEIKLVFWEKGFEGTSTRDIVAVTGLGWQSLYGYFGDKRRMYLSALEDYVAKELKNSIMNIDPDVSPKSAFSKFLIGIIDRDERRGCFLCNAAVDQAQLDEAGDKPVTRQMEILEQRFAERLMKQEEYERDPELRKLASAHMLVAYCGLQMLMRTDLPRKVLRRAVKASTSELIDSL